MKPTASLSARLRFSTKDVARGFYRGNRTGSAGAHTPYGGYLIDWRKVRNYNVPDLSKFRLTPYVTREIGELETPEKKYDWEEGDWQESGTDISARQLTIGRRTRAIAFLNQWRHLNPQQFESYLDHQDNEVREMLDQEKQGATIELFQRYRSAEKMKRLQQSKTEAHFTVG